MINIIFSTMTPFEESCIVKNTGEILKFSEMNKENLSVFSDLKKLLKPLSVIDKSFSNIEKVTLHIFDDSVIDEQIKSSIVQTTYDKLSLEEKSIIDKLISIQ